MRTGGLDGVLSPRLVAVSIGALLLAMTLAFMGSSSGTHDASVSMVPINSKAGVTIGYTLTVTNASGDNIDNVTLEVPLDEGGNARYRVATPVPAPENWSSELPENDGFGYAKKITWRTDNAHIPPSSSEDFTFTATTPLYDGTYNWTCRTRDISAYVDNDSITTRVDNVPPPRPELVWPDNDENINDNTPNLDWHAVPENSLPVTYDLLVDNDPDFLSPEVDVTGIATDDYVTAELGENRWYWKVRAVDNAGNIGAWSSPRSFRVDITPPEPPTRVWPGDGENINDNTPNLDWDPVIDPSMPVTYDLMFGWWNDNWLKRRSITIQAGENGMPENYQLKIIVAYDADMQADFDDLRFALAYDTLLPYWVENYNLSENATVFVSLPFSLGANASQQIYMYYDNPTATSASSGDSTFNFFDTCDNLDKWTTISGTWIIEGGAIKGEGSLGFLKITNSPQIINKEIRLNIKWNRPGNRTAGVWPKVLDSDNFIRNVLSTEGDGDGVKNQWAEGGSYGVVVLAHSVPANTWFFQTISFYENTLRVTITPPYAELTNTNDKWGKTWTEVRLNTNGSTGWFDNIIIRQYVFPEPTASVGDEESSTQTGITDDNYQITTELNEGIWHWKLRAVDNAGNIGVWLSLSFRVDITPPVPPTLLAPADKTKTCDNTPTFRWTAITIENSLPATYDLQVDNDNNFLSPEVDNTDLTENTYTPPSELPNGNYSWRVRARDNASNYSVWSSAWTLLINSTPHDATVILAPINSKPGISIDYVLTVTDNATGDNIDNVTLEIPLDENDNALYRVATPIPAPAGWMSGVPTIDGLGYATRVRWWTDNPSAHIAAGESENFTFTATTPLYDRIYTWTCLTRDIIGYVDNDSITTRVATTAWQLIETWAGTVEAPAAWQLVETWTGTIETPPWIGTAFFRLKNLYTVYVEKILDLYQGSKLVVKFYTYGNAFENENIIENFSPPWHVEENESARHPEGGGVKKAVLVLTSDNTENVISTIASFTVRKVDLEIRFTEVPLEWALASPEEKVALEIEFSEVPLYWALAPS